MVKMTDGALLFDKVRKEFPKLSHIDAANLASDLALNGIKPSSLPESIVKIVKRPDKGIDHLYDSLPTDQFLIPLKEVVVFVSK